MFKNNYNIILPFYMETSGSHTFITEKEINDCIHELNVKTGQERAGHMLCRVPDGVQAV